MSKTSLVTALSDLSNHPADVTLKSLFAAAIESHRAIALWQLPDNSYQQVVIDLASSPLKVKPDLENLATGFLFAPFKDLEQSIYLNADVYFNTNSTKFLTADLTDLAQQKVRDDLLTLFQKKLKQNNKSSYVTSSTNDNKGTSEKQFSSLVNQSITAIKDGQFHKVVPARKMVIDLPKDFHPADTFLSLCKKYPKAFVSLVAIPNVGTWLGASPETLVSIDRNQIFTTAALAGTQSEKVGTDPLEIAWRQKEIEEQAMVSRYIINCFKKIRLREFEELGPRTVKAGNLWHLKTTYQVDMNAVNFPQLGTVMLELLHPTSAVCGLPQDKALSFLNNHEGFDREFFSGFLGPVNVDLESHIFVNLRCMQLCEQQGVLYAGAGVTAHSDATKEWVETELKCQTLLKVLNPDDQTI